VVDTRARLGPLELRSPLIAAAGTVGGVYDFEAVGALEAYGAAVAKSVSAEPWSGRPAPRIGSAGEGMLNGIGIQNPGIEVWAERLRAYGPTAPVPIWGSAVGGSPEEFARVAAGLESAGVAAVEVNLSCPNLEQGSMFALDPAASGAVVAAVRRAVSVPVGAKLSPNAPDVVAIAAAVGEACADWVVATNTMWGAAIDVATRRPVLSGVVGGYSGAPLKPVAMRCVWEISQALPGLPVVGCGGVRTGADVVEYLLAGAAAVAIGTAHFAEPRIGRAVLEQMVAWCSEHGVEAVSDLVGEAVVWE
jgi:dihydroorotate dehydrogenase (NAD+) catalytic subunit